MHLSLKSSLGRQYLDDAMGNKLLSQFGGAAAAYSLRNLTGNGGDVVRVRRESDNAERDFTARDITSGEMVNWVNRQLVPPLDIGIETGDGRPSVPDGGTSIGTPAAAYSLRSLGTTQADDIIPSGDTVTPSAGAYVVQVRRSSDDNVKSFTASEVSDGTLEGFVNEIQTLGTVANSVGNNDFTLTNASSTGFTATLASGVGVCGWEYTAKSGDKITVSFDAVVRSGSPQLLPRRATALSSNNLASVVSDSPLSVNSTGSYSFEFTYNSDEAGSLTFSEGDSPSDFDVSNFQVTVFKGAGFVRTWYDQSTNDNHATQTDADAQPKIVEGGFLVSGGLDFDGVNDKLSFDSSISLSTNDFFVTSVLKVLDGDGEDIIIVSNDAGNRFLMSLDYDNFSAQLRADDGTFVTETFSAAEPTGNILATVQRVSNTTTLFHQGSSASTFDVTSKSFTLGSFGQRTPTQFSKHSIKEIIIYASDQSDNRTAIEANLGEHYSITGIPAYDDTVNGFVETWYDQSGNGNDATQLVAANQPKIVNGGSLVTETSKAAIEFDGSDDGLASGNVPLFSNTDGQSVFAVFNSDTAINSIIIDKYSAIGGERQWAVQNDSYNVQENPSSFNADNIAQISSTTGNRLQTNIWSPSVFTNLYKNGSLVATATTSATDIGTTTQLVRIGEANATGENYFDGKIQEIIVYDSEQSSNRPAIETNINNHYDIYS